MSKTAKKLIIIASCVVGAGLLIWLGMTLARNLNRKPVKVYPVSDVCMTDYYGDTGETSGIVTADKIQKVFSSSTQKITEVFVQEGDTVSKGDKLLAYDTSLSEIDVRKAEIAVGKTEAALNEAKEELQRLYSAMITENLEAQLASLEAALDKAMEETPGAVPEYPELPCGGFLLEDPYYLESDGSFTPDILFKAAESAKAAQEADKEKSEIDTDNIFIVLVDVTDGEYTGYTGINISKKKDLKVTFFDARPLEPKEAVVTEEIENLERQIAATQELLGASYTRQELAMLQNSQQGLIQNLEVQLKVDQLDYQQKLLEAGDGFVYADVDGTVRAVRSEDEASAYGTPLIEVSGGGGYFISGTISELELGTVTVGTTVTVNSWTTGTSCEGEIVEIGENPSHDQFWGSGNNNVSRYPVKIFTDESANLIDNDYVSVTYQKKGDSNSWYLENMFVRYDNGRPYVFVKGDSERLEKRYISVGGEIWNSYTEIRDGITTEDFIAFPYGNDCVDGAKTLPGEVQELYNY